MLAGERYKDMSEPTIALHCHRITLRPASIPGVRQSNSNFCGGNDVLQVLRVALNELGTRPSNNAQEKAHLSLEGLADPTEKRVIEGTFRYGTYGFNLPVVSAATGNKEGQITSAQVVPHSFFFLFYAPLAKLECYLITQRFRNHGISTTLCYEINKKLKERFPQLVISTSKLVLESVWLDYLGEGEAKEFRMSKRIPPDDSAEQVDMKPNIQFREVYMSYKIRSANLSEVLQKLRTKSITPKGVLEIIDPNSDFNPGRGSLVIDSGRGKRTLDLADPLKMSAFYDITDNVTLTDDGTPNMGDIRDQSYEYLRRILREENAESTDV